MSRILELVGGPPASGKSTYIRRRYGAKCGNEFVHLDYDAMVVQEVGRYRYHSEVREQEIRDHVSMQYGRERSMVCYGDTSRVTVDWPFCVSRRAEEYISIGRSAGRIVECNFITTQATEAWRRFLTRHVAGEFNAFTIFLRKDIKDIKIAEVLRPGFKMFLEAHRDMPACVDRVFPQADVAYLWDNNMRDTESVLIARCFRDKKIEVLDHFGWDRFQYKREINIDAEFEVITSHVEAYLDSLRTVFEVKYSNLII